MVNNTDKLLKTAQAKKGKQDMNKLILDILNGHAKGFEATTIGAGRFKARAGEALKARAKEFKDRAGEAKAFVKAGTHEMLKAGEAKKRTQEKVVRDFLSGFSQHY